MNSIKKIELLSPAKDIECGIAAINHGADAVYIGADKFGARKLACNSLSDLEKLVKHAHLYRSKVYVTVNTLLYDDELEEAEKMIWDIYNIGADALIVQDMGILQMNLPPIALHASTQTDNRTTEKVKFLEQAGFEQIILARELSLAQIKDIRKETDATLEFFVHGALCVSYSGRCYMSYASTERSANRGECSQPCRLPYTLETSSGKVIVKNKHLLSLKDLNLSERLEDLIDAGITSFKIEGRLKDAGYVKNITAYYRQKLDDIIAKRDDLAKSSSGKCRIDFTPMPEKSFSRGFSTYFINGRQKEIWSIDTPKSTGEKIGEVSETGKDFFIVNSDIELHNGDGLCFFDALGILTGIKVNRVEKNRIFAYNLKGLKNGTMLYRNYSHLFNNELDKSNENRRIGVHINFAETEEGISCELIDEDGIASVISMHVNKEIAINGENIISQIKNQLSKLGDSPFYVLSMDVKMKQPLFLRISQINDIRRRLVESHIDKRNSIYKREERKLNPTMHPYKEKIEDFESNVLNKSAVSFYKQHGINDVPFGFESLKSFAGKKVMTAKHCIRYMLNLCHKENNIAGAEDLILKSEKNKYLLKFDCRKCEMIVRTKNEELF